MLELNTAEYTLACNGYTDTQHIKNIAKHDKRVESTTILLYYYYYKIVNLNRSGSEHIQYSSMRAILAYVRWIASFFH